MSPDARQTFEVDRALDLKSTLAGQRFGNSDPTVRFDALGFWRATRTPEGPATVHVTKGEGIVTAEAWGPGAQWIVPRVRALAGLDDAAETFDPPPGLIHDLVRRHRGLRLARAPWPWEALMAAILQQRVQFQDAMRGYRGLFRIDPEPAPGPIPLMLPPKPRAIAYLSSSALVELGIDRKRAETLRSAALVAHRVDGLVDRDYAEVRRLLHLIPGCGPWTVEMVVSFTFGDPDSVTTGDFHLPNVASYALAGEPRADDARMIELLEPYKGHRFRVMRLLAEGGPTPPKYGPRLRAPGPRRF